MPRNVEKLELVGHETLRWSLVVIFLWFGGMKFTVYEAEGIAGFTANSPIFSWLHALAGVQGSSYVIGVLELATGSILALGGVLPSARLTALGATMSMTTFVCTLTFMLTTPGVAEPSAGGLPAISAPIGQFLLKDLVLLAASFMVLVHALNDLRLPMDMPDRTKLRTTH